MVQIRGLTNGRLAKELEKEVRENLRKDPKAPAVAQSISEVAEVMKDAGNRKLQEEASRHGYNWEPLFNSVEVSDPYWSAENRVGGELTVDVEWTHPAAEYWNFGTEPHVIEGDPLAFRWDSPPNAIAEAFSGDPPLVFLQEVEVDGLPAMRFVEEAERTAKRFVENQ